MGNGNHATSPIYASDGHLACTRTCSMYNGLPAAAAAGADPVGNIEVAAAHAGRCAHPGLDRRPVDEQPDRGRRLRERRRVRAHRSANGNRPDVSAAFSAAGPNHGLRARRCRSRAAQVCLYAINIGAGFAQPVARLPDGARAGPAGPTSRRSAAARTACTCAGGSVDPDSAGSDPASTCTRTACGVAHLTAAASRPDVGAGLPRLRRRARLRRGAARASAGTSASTRSTWAPGANPLLGVPQLPRPEPDRAASTPRPAGPDRGPGPGLGARRRHDRLDDGRHLRERRRRRPDPGEPGPATTSARPTRRTASSAASTWSSRSPGGQVCAYGINVGPGAQRAARVSQRLIGRATGRSY